MNNNDYGNSWTGMEIAVIGMAGRFPGAEDCVEFWHNLKYGIETISFFSDEELHESGVNLETLRDSNYVKAYGQLEGKEYFDPFFFGYTPGEAELMNPQIRIFHECVWHALEDAGYDPGAYKDLIGLYAGSSNDFIWNALTHLSDSRKELGKIGADILTNRDFLCTRVSYKLDLKGPCFIVQTACSTSLVAIHLASRALLTGECDIGLAGGISISIGKNGGYKYREGMNASPDGHCRTFDANAKGTIGGDGVGVVVLKLLKDAIAEGDCIYAVIKGSTVNNDGIRRVGFTAPSVEGQAGVIKTACRMARVEPESITYIEAHGTGTSLGDPVELEALKLAFDVERKNFCGLGSVKSNIGHLDSAAGVAGFIKTVLALKHKLIPPTLYYETPNPGIDLIDSPFYVNTRPSIWENDGYPLRAGVSSFGLGGTNVHVVLEEAPQKRRTSKSRFWKIIVLSAKTESALEIATKNFVRYLKENPGVDLADAAYTLKVGRRAFNCRKMLVSANVDETIALLSSKGFTKVKTYSLQERNRDVVFILPDLGWQYSGMGLGLYQEESLFRQELEHCFDILQYKHGIDIRGIIYTDESQCSREDSSSDAGKGKELDSSKDQSNQFEIEPLAVFVIQYALARVLMNWGIKPQLMIGIGKGEFSVALLSGIFSLHDAIQIMVLKGKIMKESLAGNSKKAGFLLKELKKKMCHVTLNQPQIPFLSNITNDWINNKDATDPEYWIKLLSESSELITGINRLAYDKSYILAELGPGKHRHIFMMSHSDSNYRFQYINFVRPPEEKVSDIYYLYRKLGHFWLYGGNIDWAGFYAGEKRSRLPLPGYPFERNYYWLDGDFSNIGSEMMKQRMINERKPDISDCFYFPLWKQSILVSRRSLVTLQSGNYLVFMDECGFGTRLMRVVEREKNEVISVRKGESFTRISDKEFTINPKNVNDFYSLFDTLKKFDIFPNRIFHLWGLTESSECDCLSGARRVGEVLDSGFYSMLYLAMAVGRHSNVGEIQVAVVTNGMHEVLGEEIVYPEKSTVLGSIKVIPQEFPYIICRSIDITLPAPGTKKEEKLINHLLWELTPESFDTVIAYRNNHRWVQFFQELRLDEISESKSRLRKKGVYLISGGIGRLGLILAEYLAETLKARLVLIGRTVLPEREKWDAWLSDHDKENIISIKIRKIKEIEDLGGEVLALNADVADLEKMRDVVLLSEKRFGRIDGIIHSAAISPDESFGLINDVEKSKCEQQFRPKIYGLLVLEEVFRGKELDFCLLMSSMVSLLGGLGFSTYAASNLFMDSLARKLGKTQHLPWISVNWDHWRSEGKRGQLQNSPGGEKLPEIAIGKEEGKEIFRRILSCIEDNQVIVSLSFLQSRIDKWIKLKPLRDETGFNREKVIPLQPRPIISNPYVGYSNKYEQRIANLWEKFFGYSQVGVYDDFFELGGDSLKAITIISRIHKELGYKIPLVAFFKKPTISGISKYIMRAQKNDYFSIDCVEKKEYYALSSAQNRLYFIQQFDAACTVYNETQIIEINEKLNMEKLERTFEKLIKRHESLRTSFILVEDTPMQRISADVNFKIEFYDLADREHYPVVSQQTKDISDRTYIIEEIMKSFIIPFDLYRPPLLRGGIIKVKNDHYTLIVDIHHIIFDGLSNDILIRDFWVLYQGTEIPEVRLQYKDYSEWHIGKEKREAIKQQEEYWLKEFAGVLPVLNLPTDYPRPVLQSYEGSRLCFSFGSERTRALNKIALDEGTTLFMILLSIINILLAKISGQKDIVIGTPVAGRSHADLEQIIGIFVNTLALRNYPEGDKKFNEFLQEVKKKTLEAFENQEYQFEDLVDGVEVKRDMSRNPIFDVMLIYQNIEIELNKKSREFESDIEEEEYKIWRSKFDLTISVGVGEMLNFTFEYCKSLFNKKTIEKLIGYFKKIVTAVLFDKTKRISEIEIISEKEKGKVLFHFNKTKTDYPRDKTLNTLFEEQIEKNETNIALEFEDIQLTYKELNERTNQLTRLLREKGVRSDVAVGIIVKPSLEMVVGIMAVLKAGGAYLPIDPASPVTRVNYMLLDSSAKLILTQTAFVGIFNSHVYELIDLQGAGLYNGYKKNIGKTNKPDDLANIIYTSGSTANPKGVLVEHRSIVNVLFCLLKEYSISGKVVYLLKTSYVFDVSVTELFGWFLDGGKLAVMSGMEEKDPHKILDVIQARGVTHINFVPSMFNAFMNIVNPQNINKISNLEYIFLAGEEAGPESLKKFKSFNIKTGIENLYGPTEAAVYASKYSFKDWQYGSKIPIGKPLQNVELYIMNDVNNLQPIGLPAELYISGTGVARGYLNNPELKYEKFMQNFLTGNGELYKTGDLAKWRSDGNIEFLGRIDRQVKVRGYRIELGEVENYLLRYDRIKEAVVLEQGDDKQGKYLCAYLVSTDELDISELRDYLSNYLPDYMIPSYFKTINEIPKTLSGKVDVNTLALLGGVRLSNKEEYVAPTTEMEKILVEIWSNVLGGLKNIGINDNFFNLGGDSIKSIQIVSRLKQLGYKLEIKDIFRFPMITKLAPRVKKLHRISDQSVISGIIPLTPIQKKFFIEHNVDTHHYNQSVMLYSSEGLTKEVARAVFLKLQEHHDTLRMGYKEEGGEIVQTNYGLEYPLSIQEYDLQTRMDGIEQLAVKVNELQEGINLEQGPLMKLGLYHLHDGDRLLIVIHHLVIDGISWRILFEDIESLYQQCKRGESLILPPKTDSFKIWSEKLSRYSNSKVFLKEKEYWRVIESMDVSSISSDFEVNRGNIREKDLTSLSFNLDKKYSNLLLTKVNDAFGTEINDILLTGLGSGIRKIYGHDRMLIALEGHGREEIIKDIDISRTIGWFTIEYPLLLNISYENDPIRQVKEIKESLRRVPNGGIGHGILRYLTSKEHKDDIEFKLEPQIRFNYLGQFDADVERMSFSIARESVGNMHSLSGKMEYEIDVSAIIADKQLLVSIMYCKKQYKMETIEKLLATYKAELIRIISCCSSFEGKDLTPADLGYKDLTIEELDSIFD